MNNGWRRRFLKDKEWRSAKMEFTSVKRTISSARPIMSGSSMTPGPACSTCSWVVTASPPRTGGNGSWWRAISCHRAIKPYRTTPANALITSNGTAGTISLWDGRASGCRAMPRAPTGTARKERTVTRSRVHVGIYMTDWLCQWLHPTKTIGAFWWDGQLLPAHPMTHMAAMSSSGS